MDEQIRSEKGMQDINESATDIINPDLEACSDDILASLDQTELSEDSSFIKAQNAIEEFEIIEKSKYSDALLIDANKKVYSEAYISSRVAALYEILNKRAKSYLKSWCEANDWKQVWRYSQFSKKNLQFSSSFKPMTYSIVLKNNTDGTENLISEEEPTAAEARIQGAMKIGFVESLEYKRILATFDPAILKIVEFKKEYMQEVKALLLRAEIKAQIDKIGFVPVLLKDKWRKEEEERVSKLWQSMKGGGIL